jgi:hypothetical protein
MNKLSIFAGRKIKTNAVVAATGKAAKEIERALDDLPLNDEWTRKERQVATGYVRIPDEAIELALDYLGRNPNRFPDFDRAAAEEALAYSRAMSPVADLADELSSRVKTSIRMQRMLTCAQVASLYTSMKAMNRHDGSLTDIVAKLGALLRTVKRGKRGSAKPADPTGTPPVPAAAAAPAAAAPNGTTPSGAGH